MTITNYLGSSNSDFYTYTGLTSADVNDSLVTLLRTEINSAVNQKLGAIFDFTADTTKKYYEQISDHIVLVGAWQETSLVVKIGSDGDDTLETLTLGTDYRLIKFDIDDSSRTYPVVAVKLYSRFLSDNEYVQLTGTYGFEDGVPAELMLKYKLFDIFKKAVLSAQNDTDTGGKGTVIRSKISEVETTFAENASMSPSDCITLVLDILDNIREKYTYNYLGFQLIG